MYIWRPVFTIWYRVFWIFQTCFLLYILKSWESMDSISLLNQQKRFETKPNVPISSISHTISGNHFICTSPNGNLNLYSIQRPKLAKTIYSKKYGCTSATFTIKGSEGSVPNSCLIASTIPTTSKPKDDHAIRLLDLNTNSFIKYFHGHEDQVTNMQAAIWSSEGFISSSIDGTVKFWDQRSNNDIASLSLSKVPLTISYDPSGLVMAIWEPKVEANVVGTLRLVPVGDFPNSIIGSIDIKRTDLTSNANDNDFTMESIKFTQNGLIILGFLNQDLLVIDSYSFAIKAALTGRVTFVPKQNDVWRSTGCIDLSWDHQNIMAGSGDSQLMIWDLKKLNGNPIRKYHVDNPARVVSTNPKFGTMVTCDDEVILHSIY